MRRRFVTLDVFTDTALAGNPARGGARCRGTRHRGDAGDRPRVQPVRDGVRAAAGRAAAPGEAAHLHACPRTALRRPSDGRHRGAAGPARRREPGDRRPRVRPGRSGRHDPLRRRDRRRRAAAPASSCRSCRNTSGRRGSLPTSWPRRSGSTPPGYRLRPASAEPARRRADLHLRSGRLAASASTRRGRARARRSGRLLPLRARPAGGGLALPGRMFAPASRRPRGPGDGLGRRGLRRRSDAVRDARRRDPRRGDHARASPWAVRARSRCRWSSRRVRCIRSRSRGRGDRLRRACCMSEPAADRVHGFEVSASRGSKPGSSPTIGPGRATTPSASTRTGCAAARPSPPCSTAGCSSPAAARSRAIPAASTCSRRLTPRFLAYRDGGSPDGHVANAFAAIVPWSADGAILLGRMGAHTANAGQIYFPCGTPDLDDVRGDGRRFPRQRRTRTSGGDRPSGAGGRTRAWVCLRGEGQLAFLRPVRFAEEAATLDRAHGDPCPARGCAGTRRDRRGRVAQPTSTRRCRGFVRAYLASAFEADTGAADVTP